MHHMERLKKYGRIEKELARNLLAEFYGTALLRFIGTGVMAQFVLSPGTSSSPVQINIGWGLAIALSVYVAWETSGGHVNPAVTAALCILGKISFTHSFLYFIAQTLGAAFGTGIMYLVYSEAINAFDGGVRAISGPNATGIIFASFPRAYLSNTGAFIDQMAGTSLIGLFVAFCCEPKNQIPRNLMPALFGTIATTISMCCGLNMGSPVNPASDFGARIFASLIGYGTQLFTFHNYFFLVPLVAPIVGAIIGVYLYQFFIGFHIPKPAATAVNVNKDKCEMDQENGLRQVKECSQL
uniref:Bm4773, isoform a n=2 Tax=Brugia malayi TaxID=6279 RepID=A0A1I9GCJ7_BRUMA|nr:Bm4773, isoform a [Brugia malayi]